LRIFLDANVLFSAARADGAMRHLLALCEEAGHELQADAYVLEEARRNLAAKAPTALPVLDAIAARIRTGAMFPVAPSAELAALPEKDRPVLAAAIHHRCQVLVTGDRKHFGALYGKAILGVTVMSPAMLAEAILA
jgi:predicted nucleic acid-binding protein